MSKNTKKLKDKNMFVHEHLNWLNQQLLKHAREVRKGNGCVFTADGYIFVKRGDAYSPIKIRREADLKRFGFL